MRNAGLDETQAGIKIATLDSFARAVITKNHKLGDLKHQKFILSQFWRLEVQNQGVGRALLSL